MKRQNAEWEKTLANHFSWLMSKIYKELLKDKDINTICKNMAKILNKHFLKDIQMANEQMERFSDA